MAWLQALVRHWRHGFDWRAQERRLNRFPQFKVRIGRNDIHYLHVPGVGPAPRPLLLSHGWPGSVFEFLDMIELLADPARHGGDPADAFTVVVPSLPGYGLSFTPEQEYLSINGIADCLATLMTEVLGHERFAAQGGDWGAFVTTRLAHAYPERLAGIHLNLVPTQRDPGAPVPDNDEGRAYAEYLRTLVPEHTGYQAIQGTRPQTLSFGLTDSPVGLAAWIGEKFRAWADTRDGVDSALDDDGLLANISLYWFTASIGSSFFPYYARSHGELRLPAGARIGVPTGHAAFPMEPFRTPEWLARRTFTDLRRWTQMPRGGHFAAMEQPRDMAREIAALFRGVPA